MLEPRHFKFSEQLKGLSSNVLAGQLYSLGAKFIDRERGVVNFSLFSEAASGVFLCLFDIDNPQHEIARVRMYRKNGQVWRVQLAGVKPGQPYAYRVTGAYIPEYGLRFNPNKLLLDPYARAFDRPANYHRYMQGEEKLDKTHEVDISEHVASVRSEYDSGFFVPRSIVVDDDFDWQGEKRPKIPWRHTLLYEMHVKGFSKLNKALPSHLRGTYAGLGHPISVEYLKDLGVSAVQLMPVHYHIDERFLADKGLLNYWGYSSIGFFAPDMRYASRSDPPVEVVREFKQMVKNLHAAGIEVILDVVYNHTGEGGVGGSTLCFRGIDNLSYYRVSPNRPSEYQDFTGCGNTFNTSHPVVLALVLDSLRYWTNEMRVDGFRFDLTATLGRDPEVYSQRSAFFRAIHQDPILSKVKLIAEPWDVGMGGYQVGNTPYGWAELNGRYRDNVRSFWRGDSGVVSKFSSSITGSEVIYAAGSKPPQSSVNFICSHDGFTLNDLVSYNEKHNQANGENNRDGEAHNISWNCGFEGETDDEEVLRLRRRMRRNFLATLLFSQGTPFMSAGDEIGRTQKGNNNAYCQDNELSWLSWQIGQSEKELRSFVRELIAFRKKSYALRRRNYFHGARVKGDQSLRDIVWFDKSGEEMRHEDWQEQDNRFIAAAVCGSALAYQSHWRKSANDNDYLIVFNADADDVSFPTPTPFTNKGKEKVRWCLLFDTYDEKPFADARENPRFCSYGDILHARARSMQVFVKDILEKTGIS